MKLLIDQHLYNTDLFSDIFPYGTTQIVMRHGEAEQRLHFHSAEERDKVFNVIAAEAADLADYCDNGAISDYAICKKQKKELLRLLDVLPAGEICPNSR